jgi:RNA polymerase sigma-70 factor (ECF subfamily)
VPAALKVRPSRTAGTSEWRYVGHDESRPASSAAESRADLDRLLDAVARGEHGAFDLIYEQLREPIQRQVRAVLRDQAQSEEVTQEVLLELWRTAFRYDPAKGSAVNWAMTIAHRRAVDRVRRTAASAAREQRAVMSAALWNQTGEAAETAFDREHLLRCLDQLSGLQREAITLAFYGEHTYGQVAAILDVPLGTVKARIRDALIKLRGYMLSEP